MKVRINATGDTIVLKFVRPNPDIKLEGYILGYGSSMFSKQFIQLPENGEPYETEIGELEYNHTQLLFRSRAWRKPTKQSLMLFCGLAWDWRSNHKWLIP